MYKNNNNFRFGQNKKQWPGDVKKYLEQHKSSSQMETLQSNSRISPLKYQSTLRMEKPLKRNGQFMASPPPIGTVPRGKSLEDTGNGTMW